LVLERLLLYVRLASCRYTVWRRLRDFSRASGRPQRTDLRRRRDAAAPAAGRRGLPVEIILARTMRQLLPLATMLALSIQAPVEMKYPARDVGVDTLAERKQAQLATASQFKVFHDFQFADRVRESGITFVNHAIDDAVAHYKMSHDDHGTGIAVADV